jgi:hypothetical protein
MKLITRELEKRFAKIGSQIDKDDPIVIVKFFNPTGAGTWYATEYNPIDKIFYGYAVIFGDHNDEWGSFSLAELESFKGRFGLGIERDLYCGEQKISEFNIPSLRKEKEYAIKGLYE